jgi:alpha-mannosidase
MITRNSSLLTLLLIAALHAPSGRAVETNRLSQIVVVFKTHFDIGYTDMATNIVQRYRTTMIDQALDVVDQNRNLPPQQQFAWTLAGWPLYKILQD